jgi:CelD/BcsL family acetyltransferase involved in cellulose biosynthesis
VTGPIASQRGSESSAPDRDAIPARGREAAELRPVELTTDVVTDIDGIRALKPDYERLQRVTGNTLPFALQEWHLAWCAHFLNSHPQIHEQPLFCVLRDRSGECVALVPLVWTRRRVGPLGVSTVDVIGADPGLTEIRLPLIEPGYERLTVRAVHASLARLGHWDWIQWRGVRGALAEAMTIETAPRWHRISDDYVLDLPPTWPELHAGLKRNVRESLRHCYNSLRRDGHAFEFVVAREREEVRRALGRFLELHAMRAIMPRVTRHPNRFTGRQAQDFLYDVCGRLAARDAVRVFQLRIGAAIVASRIAFVVGDSVYLYYSGFDPAWARYSVMTTTVAEALKYAIASGLRSANLSLTAEQSKLRWRPRLVEFHSALVHRESLGSRIACSAYRAAMSDGVAAQLLRSVLARRWQ